MDYTIIITVLALIFILPFLIDKYNNPRLDKNNKYLIYLIVLVMLLIFPRVLNLFISGKMKDENNIRLILIMISSTISLSSLIYIYL